MIFPVTVLPGRGAEGLKPQQLHTDVPIQDLLVMAVALHGSTREVIRGEQLPTANGRPIVMQALIWLGSWNPVTEEALCCDGDDPIVDGLYKTLIGMCRPRKELDLVAGFGNLGSDTGPPAHPTYVAFGLTDRGREYVQSLFKKHPELRSFKDEEN